MVYICNDMVFNHKKKLSSDTSYNMVNLENVMPNEISQIQKDKYFIISLI
jgi:hypothetical protein